MSGLGGCVHPGRLAQKEEEEPTNIKQRRRCGAVVVAATAAIREVRQPSEKPNNRAFGDIIENERAYEYSRRLLYV